MASSGVRTCPYISVYIITRIDKHSNKQETIPLCIGTYIHTFIYIYISKIKIYILIRYTYI